MKIDDFPYKFIDLFSGIGGMSLALAPLGFRTTNYCDSDETARAVLLANMRRGLLDKAPIHEDIRTLRAKDIQGRVDCLTAGSPCQGLSQAGKHGGLLGDRRSALGQHDHHRMRGRQQVRQGHQGHRRPLFAPYSFRHSLL
mgnify:CR=1 FL=1